MTDSSSTSLSRASLTALVIGSMVGAGIFTLPAKFATASGGLAALAAWGIAGGGMLMLAFVFQTLSQRRPDLDAGIYAYAKAGFGDYLGFAAALGYWITCCLAQLACLILIKATLGAFVPIFGDGSTPAAVLSASLLLWGVHALVLRGITQAAALNTIATVAKIVPLLAFLVAAALAFRAEVFAANFAPRAAPSLFEQVRGTMLLTVFVFVGIEGASVYSRLARQRSDVGFATVAGFLVVLALLVAVTMLSYGILPQAELAQLPTPSVAGVMAAIVGPWGLAFVSLSLIVSVLGNYLSWALLAAEVLFSAARHRTMPSFLARENRNQVPVSALWLSNLVIQAFLIVTSFADETFALAMRMTSAMTLLPYLLVAGYGLQLAWSGETYAADPRGRRGDLLRSAVAVVYAAAMLIAGGLTFLLLSAAVYAPGTALYVLAQRERGAPLFSARERLLFALVVVAALAAVHGLWSGAIAV
ncbi:MAG: basic amino acid/polyamine antiporter [Deltaproteobacteria bacterium]|nr:basic amino acid/polyamine antiporter [Deltaproteobacteria bacterium]